eukprot:GHUV01037760.1.p1 GENE.GHUV01037760.1~~GHUV01037760.1.p1  ORF type:complete len:101 (-),score=15.00 GHUV01037760.1:227-529(-)
MSDDKGNTLVLTCTASPPWAERVMRAACTEMGCSVGLASTPMTGKTAKQVRMCGHMRDISCPDRLSRVMWYADRGGGGRWHRVPCHADMMCSSCSVVMPK